MIRSILDKNMVRPRKEEPLEKLINIRVSKRTHEKLQEIAKVSGLRMYDVVRRRLEGTRIPDKSYIELLNEVGRLRQTISKQGGLIKHLYSMNPFEPQVTLSILKKQESAFEKVNLLLEDMRKKLNDNKNNQ